MSARKAQDRPSVKALHFCENDRDLPIAGTPAPKPCPFCGGTDCSVVFRSDADNTGSAYTMTHVQCETCGAEAGYVSDRDAGFTTSYDLALESARIWNSRK